MSTDINIQPVIDAAIRGTEPAEVVPGSLYAVTVPKDGRLQVVDTMTDAHLDVPTRKRGTVAAQSADALVAYLKRHGTDATEVFADRVNHKIVGVINSHAEADAGWGDHRVEFSIQPTVSWQAWMGNDGKLIKQVEFAEFLEDHQTDLHQPPAADMLKIAESIQGTVSAAFESTRRLSNGSVQIEYREDAAASADKGRLEVPLEFTIAVRPFEGVAAYSLRARFRYRLSGGNITLAYKLIEPELVVDDAFTGVLADIQHQLTLAEGVEGNGPIIPVLDGVPAAPTPATPARVTIVD